MVHIQFFLLYTMCLVYLFEFGLGFNFGFGRESGAFQIHRNKKKVIENIDKFPT